MEMNEPKQRDITGYFLRKHSAKNNTELTQKMANNKQSNERQQLGMPVCSMDSDNVAQEPVVSTAELKALIIGMERSLTTRLDRMETELKSMKSDQRQMEDEIKGLEHDVLNTASKVDDIEKVKLPSMENKMESKLQHLQDKVTKMEIHDRRMNLLFYGVEEKPNENLTEVIHDFFLSDFGMSQEIYDDLVIVNAHRLPRKTPRPGPNPIIIRFGYMSEVQYFLNFVKRRPYNKDKKPIMVYTDLPPELKIMRGKAAAKAKVLRDSGKQTRIRVVGTKVVLELRNRPRRGAPPGIWTQIDY